MWLDNALDHYSERNKKFIFLTPCLYAVGTAAENILYGLIKAKNNKKKLIILRPRIPEGICKYTLSNPELYRLENEYICNRSFKKYVFELLLTIVFFTTRLTSLFLQRFNVYLRDDLNFPVVGVRELWRGEISNRFDWDSVYSMGWEKSDNIFSIVIPGENESYQEIKSSLFPGDSQPWFVCLHVRESGYRNDAGRREYRNNRIENYLPLIEEIVNRGGYVVRMGDRSMTKLPVIEKVIDYPFHKLKNPKNDLILIKNCRFYIGNQSGIWDIANLFSKPTITTDMNQWVHAFPVKYGDLGIYKNIYDSKLNRVLSFDEVMNSGWAAMTLTEDMSDRYSTIDNSPEQLKLLIVEYFEWLNNGIGYSALQKETNKAKIEIGKRIIDEYFTDKAGYDIDAIKYKYACRLLSSFGALSDNYLSDLN